MCVNYYCTPVYRMMNCSILPEKGLHDIFDDFVFLVIFGTYYFDLNDQLFAKWYGQLYHVSKSNFCVPPVDKNSNVSDKCMTLLD